MIICADLNMINYGHVPFNTAMLKMICKLYPDDQVVFYSESKNINHIKLNFSYSNLIYEERKFYCKGTGLKIFIKEFLEFYNFSQIIRNNYNCNTKLIILFSVHPFSHFLIKYFYSKIKIFIVLHGELEYVKKKNKLNLKIFGWFLKKALKRQSNVKYIVLGEVIKDNLFKYCKAENEVCWIDHPYIYSEVKQFKSDCNMLKIASIGFANENKKSQFIFELGENLKEFINKKQLNLEIIGAICSDIIRYKNLYVDYMDTNEALNEKEYSFKIQQVDYALFFYDNNAYQLCASGAFFDAVKFEKPIITIKNAFFEHYFNEFGNIGYMCNDFKEIVERVKYILECRPTYEYCEQVKNLKNLKKSMSLTVIQNKLLEIFEQ